MDHQHSTQAPAPIEGERRPLSLRAARYEETRDIIESGINEPVRKAIQTLTDFLNAYDLHLVTINAAGTAKFLKGWGEYTVPPPVEG